VELAEKAVRRIGLKPEFVTTGGGSDVNELNRKGLPCVNLAIGMEKLHTADEYIAIESMLQAHELVLAIVQEALD
jgi:tripeptide aminopeptidase